VTHKRKRLESREYGVREKEPGEQRDARQAEKQQTALCPLTPRLNMLLTQNS
jgi:hypothetical protein